MYVLLIVYCESQQKVNAFKAKSSLDKTSQWCVYRLNIPFPDDLTKFIVFFNHLEKFLQNLKDFVWKLLLFMCQNSSISNNSIKHKYTVSMSKTVLFQAIQFSKSSDCSISNSSVQHTYTVSMSKTVVFQKIQFSIHTQFQCQKQFYFKQFSLAYNNSSISNNSVQHKYAV